MSGNTAKPRRKRTNRSVDVPERTRAARRWAETATPRSVQWALIAQKIVGHRFTPLQWWCLVLAYPRCSCGCGAFKQGRRSDAHVARALGLRPHNVRKAREAAERIAYELMYVWHPARDKWHRIKQGSGEVLDEVERASLSRFRGSKKGRRTFTVGGVPTPYDDVDVLDVVGFTHDADGTVTPYQRRYTFGELEREDVDTGLVELPRSVESEGGSLTG